MLGIAGIGNSIYYDPYLYGSSANTGSVSALSANTSTGSASASSSANTAAASSNSASAAASTQTADSTSKASSDGKTVVNPGQSEIKQPGRKSSPSECQTCKNRKYQDGSNESNVSFKSAQDFDPASA